MTMFIDQFNDGEELLNLAFFFIKFSLLLRYFPPHAAVAVQPSFTFPSVVSHNGSCGLPLTSPFFVSEVSISCLDVVMY
jgi:hypothetical protein